MVFLLGTFLCRCSTYHTLVGARIATGGFGGILGGLAMTIIGDVFPAERRGRATGSLMTGFAFASVAGVPLGLFLGTNFGWHVPFIALVLVGIPILLLVPYAMPPLTGHIHSAHAHPLKQLIETFSFSNHVECVPFYDCVMVGSFSVFPYVSTYFVANVGAIDRTTTSR